MSRTLSVLLWGEHKGKIGLKLARHHWWQADKQKQEALRRRGLRKCFKEKAEQAEESREERSVREREAANLRLIDAVGALERKDTIRHQQELSQYKLKQFRQDKIRSASVARC